MKRPLVNASNSVTSSPHASSIIGTSESSSSNELLPEKRQAILSDDGNIQGKNDDADDLVTEPKMAKESSFTKSVTPELMQATILQSKYINVH